MYIYPFSCREVFCLQIYNVLNKMCATNFAIFLQVVTACNTYPSYHKIHNFSIFITQQQKVLSLLLVYVAQCQVDYTSSNWNAAAKQPWVWLLLIWVTAGEHHVLLPYKPEDQKVSRCQGHHGAYANAHVFNCTCFKTGKLNKICQLYEAAKHNASQTRHCT